LKITSIVGARPQFVKAAAVLRAVAARSNLQHVLIHTGQHYDDNMSEIFFRELAIPKPEYCLGVGSASQGAQTARMLESIEEVLIRTAPNCVLVYGDTNSTLAAALAAVKLHIPLAHVEAGLRSFNRRMSEEINRVLTDHASDMLFAPTATAVENLRQEGIPQERIFFTGDVMFDAALFYADKAAKRSTIIERLSLKSGAFVLATCHRAESTDDRESLAAIVDALAAIAEEHTVVFPMHPRTKKALAAHGLQGRLGGVRVIDPVSFLDMVALEKNARVILTDSGGVQKEAFFYGVPCVTMRDETEWVETVLRGRNHLAGRTADRIRRVFANAVAQSIDPDVPNLYGNGDAARRIEATLARN